MNLFEEFLYSPKNSRGHSSPMRVAIEQNTPETVEASLDTEDRRSREEILAHIQRQDEEVEAAIQSQILHGIPKTPEAQQATTSSTSEEHNTGRPDSERDSIVGDTQLRFPWSKNNRPILPVISPREGKAQQKVAKQATWVEALRAGHDPTKPPQGSPRKTSWIAPEAADSATSAPLAPSSGPIFTADQLAEAASFASGATRGGARVRLPPSRASKSARPKAFARDERPAARLVAARKAPPPQPSNASGPKPSAASSNTLPPHLRKQMEARALRESSGHSASNASETGSSSQKTQDQASNTGLLPAANTWEVGCVASPISAPVSDLNGGACERENRLEATESSALQASDECFLKDFRSGLKGSRFALLATPPRKLSQESVQSLDAPEESPAEQIEKENAPPINNLAARAMSKEVLKSFNPSSQDYRSENKQPHLQCDQCKRWTSSLRTSSPFLCNGCQAVDIDRLDEANRMINGASTELRTNEPGGARQKERYQWPPRKQSGPSRHEESQTLLDSRSKECTEAKHSEATPPQQSSWGIDLVVSQQDSDEDPCDLDHQNASAMASQGDVNESYKAIPEFLAKASPQRYSSPAPAESGTADNQNREATMSSTRPERQAIAKTAVEMLNKEADRRRTEMTTSQSFGDSTSAGDNASRRSGSQHQAAYQHPDLLDLDFAFTHASAEPTAKPVKSGRTSSLAPQAHPFFAPISKPNIAERAPAVQAPVARSYSQNVAYMPTGVGAHSPAPVFATTYDGALQHAFGSGTSHLSPGPLHYQTMRGSHSGPASSPYGAMLYQDWDPYTARSTSPGLSPYALQPSFGSYNTTAQSQGPIALNQNASATVSFYTNNGQVRKVTPLRALPIVKPPEKKYDDAFPALPATSKDTKPKSIVPPPGLQAAKGDVQSTFDALLRTEKHLDSARGTSIQGVKSFSGNMQRRSTSLDADIADGSASRGKEELLAHSGVQPAPQQHPEYASTDNGDGGETAVRLKAGEASVSPAISPTKTKTAAKRKKQTLRASLREAWAKREGIRTRLLGTWTLDGARALEDETETYNALREDLASCMANGELNEEDSRVFPRLEKSSLAAPKVRPGAHAGPKMENVHAGQKSKQSPVKKSPTDMAELMNKALDARNRYDDAHAVFRRPPPQGRTNLKQLREHAEAKIEFAAKHYAQKRLALADAYGGELPAKWKEALWTYDDKAVKRSRDAWNL
ncbi:hypothetical protein LTR37_013871 [Vermiconidia calcicola]|uniref:Uncharacterized protein n=1 Tax=Vermiconidia calcicola TaxID=1690605 RepID=A0ACC3MV45_9PEZI|nr:hypothetical protein LTR37_013871 [Vermiconidia calcicola]